MLEKEILAKHRISREYLSELLSGELHCAKGVIKNLLRGGTPFYPIIVLQKLLIRSSRPQFSRRQILKSISVLKVNSASAKPAKAVTTLSEDLAKIIGAFAADGSLSVQLVVEASTEKHLETTQKALPKIIQLKKIRWSPTRKKYYIAIQLNEYSRDVLACVEKISDPNALTQMHSVIELTDEYEDNVRAFAKWIKTIFDIEPTSLKVRRGKRAWRVIFSSKILARYLTEFFGMKSGLKTYTISEPDIVKNAKLNIRREFAKGALMFDGCVTKGGKITFSTKSKDFTSAIQEIWIKDKIACGVLSRNRRGEYSISTIVPNRLQRLLKYFEPDTQKWKLLQWINGATNSKPIIKKSGALSAEKILSLLNEIKSCDINFMERHFKRRYTSVRHYLHILIKHKKIKITHSPHIWGHYINEKTSVYLSKRIHDVVFTAIREKLGMGKSVARVLEIHKGTFSAWKKRKNGIPVEILKKLAPLLGFKLKELTRAVIQTDRDIIELT